MDQVEPAPGPLDRIYRPTDLLLHPSGRYLYVLSSNFDGRYRERDGGSVLVLDTEAMTLVPDAGVRIASYGAAMTLADTAENPRLFVSARGNGGLFALDVAGEGGSLRCEGSTSGAACRLPGPGRDPTGIAWLGRRAGPQGSVDLVAATALGGTVALLGVPERLADTRSVRAAGPQGALYLRPDSAGDGFYVGGRFDNFVIEMGWSVDEAGYPRALGPRGRVQLPSSVVDRRNPFPESRDMVFSPLYPQAYVALINPRGLFVIALDEDADGRSTRRVTGRIPLESQPGRFVVAATEEVELLYVALPQENSVAVVEPVSSRVLERFVVGERPWALALDAERERLYVAHFLDNSIGKIELGADHPERGMMQHVWPPGGAP